MRDNKDKITNLIKSHINYISLIIFLVGLMLKYSVPSLFPFLIKLDINFYSSILIEFSILLFLGNKLIEIYREEINKNLFSKIIEEKIGWRGVPLITELTNIINPFSYNVGLDTTSDHVKKADKRDKLYIAEQVNIIKVYPKQNNVHYVFNRGASSTKKIVIDYIKLNDKKLILSKDLRIIESRYPLPVGEDLSIKTYQVLIPLKAGKEYVFEIKTIHPPCMSDLNDGKEYDYHEYTFFTFTERIKITDTYDFENFEDYDFKAERKYMNLPDVEEIHCDIDYKKKKVIVESGNLKNGDKICLIYYKKK